MDLKQYIRTIPDWPKPGIQFRDITTLLLKPEAFRYAMDQLAEHYREIKLDKIVAIESRGFLFGSILAERLNKPLVLIRKPGKLPGEIDFQEYELEYGTDRVEIHKDAISNGERVVVIDDLLATGGTVLAAIQLVEKRGGKIVDAGFIVDLPDIGGSKRLAKKGYTSFTLVEFEGD